MQLLLLLSCAEHSGLARRMLLLACTLAARVRTPTHIVVTHTHTCTQIPAMNGGQAVPLQVFLAPSNKSGDPCTKPATGASCAVGAGLPPRRDPDTTNVARCRTEERQCCTM